jgi:ABC-2 type transport system permease protein
VERRVRALGDSHNPDDPRFTRLRAETLARHAVTRVEALPFNYNGVLMREAEALTSGAYREHLGGLLDTYARHERVVEMAAFISPYVAIRAASMLLSGVDGWHAIEFERQAEDYRYALIQELNDLHAHEVSHAQDRYVGLDGGGAPTRQRIDRAHFQGIPTFDYRPPDVGSALRAQPAGTIALAVWVCAALTGLVLLGRRAVLL